MMRFKLLKVNNSDKLLKLSKIKRSFLSKKEDMSLFHYFEVEQDLFHIVMHINDEYLLTTKKNGNYMNVPFSHYINCFFLKNSHYFFIEDIGDGYINDITAYLSKKTNAEFDSIEFNNKQIEKLISYFPGFIRKVEYKNQYDDFVDYENITMNQFQNYNLELDIDFVTFLVNSNFISIYKNGKISVDNSEEEYVINFVKDVTYGLEKNTY